MTSWSDVAEAAPVLAHQVQRCFDAHIHKTIATLRRDGSPRISGIEAKFHRGELTIGMMPESFKAQDVRRDNRIALHSASPDPEQKDATGAWPGDAKVAGRAIQVSDPQALGYAVEEIPPGGGLFFRIDISEVVSNRLGGDPPDHMLIDFWTPEHGLRQAKRS